MAGQCEKRSGGNSGGYGMQMYPPLPAIKGSVKLSKDLIIACQDCEEKAEYRSSA